MSFYTLIVKGITYMELNPFPYTANGQQPGDFDLFWSELLKIVRPTDANISSTCGTM